MNRSNNAATHVSIGVPRACGDEPERGVKQPISVKRSPRMRG